MNTSIADIRKTSGATTGSIYHFFGNKAGIAIAIWQDAILGWSEDFKRAAPENTAKAQIKASVQSLLMWARNNPDHFAIYDEILFLSRTVKELAPIQKIIADGHAISSVMFEAWAKSGDVQHFPWAQARALMLGPSMELLRARQPFSDDQIEIFANTAWQSVRSS